jgi:hypothetical protein
MATLLAITANKWHDIGVNILLSGLTRPRLRGAIFQVRAAEHHGRVAVAALFAADVG